MSAALTVNGLSVSIGSTPILRDVSLSIGAGETVALVGPSGSGKSTLALAVLGLLPRGARRTGSIRVGDVETVGLSDDAMSALRGRRVSVVFQDPAAALDPLRPVGRQVEAAVLAHASPSAGALRARIDELLGAAGLDAAASLRASLPHQLSGGERQRIAIAIALAHDPELVIADEPTTALDATTEAHVLDTLIDARRRAGGALLLITHDVAVATTRVDRVVAIRDGAVVDTVETDEPLPPIARRPARPPVLVARGLGKRTVRDLSLELQPGRTLGLIGPSGSGKTTTVRLLAGLETPDAGTIERPPRRGDIGIVFQDPARSLDPHLRVRSIVAEPLQIAREPRASITTRVADALDAVGIDASLRDRYPHELSTGEAQRVAIARAIVTRPRVLLLDEPVSSLDATSRRGVLQLLVDLQVEHDLAHLFISHDRSVIDQVADDVVALGP